jgi:hypothetical protein
LQIALQSNLQNITAPTPLFQYGIPFIYPAKRELPFASTLSLKSKNNGVWLGHVGTNYHT